MACYNQHKCKTCPNPCKTEVRDTEHAKWFSSLTVNDKETLTGYGYPSCTVVWNAWSRDEREIAIEKSGIVRAKRNKQNTLGHDF